MESQLSLEQKNKAIAVLDNLLAVFKISSLYLRMQVAMLARAMRHVSWNAPRFHDTPDLNKNRPK